MEASIRWLRASYIAGGVADLVIGILILVPSRMGETEFRYAMGVGATMVFGWTALLLWAYMKPVERKGVLLLTIFPVITGLIATGIWAAASGFFPLQRIVPTSVLGLALILLMGFSYLKARRESGRR